MNVQDILAAFVAQALQIGTLNAQLGRAEQHLADRDQRIAQLEAEITALRPKRTST